jgi:hypothetical protein
MVTGPTCSYSACNHSACKYSASSSYRYAFRAAANSDRIFQRHNCQCIADCDASGCKYTAWRKSCKQSCCLNIRAACVAACFVKFAVAPVCGRLDSDVQLQCSSECTAAHTQLAWVATSSTLSAPPSLTAWLCVPKTLLDVLHQETSGMSMLTRASMNIPEFS